MSTKIKCPKCSNEINVDDILKHQIEDGFRKEYDQKILKLNQDKTEFDEKKKRENELFLEKLEKEKSAAAILIEEKLKCKMEDEQKEKYALLQKELSEKSEKIKDLFKKEAEISKLQREKSELKDALEAENQKKLNEALVLERDKVKKEEEEKSLMKIKELEKQLKDQKTLTDEMKRKQEQGSTQLQGEVLELEVERLLKSIFPSDHIEEIKKGENGADCLHRVKNSFGQEVGSIAYESKRTKSFNNAWIDKLKNDKRNHKASIGVIVTEVLPKEMTGFGIRDGIWICTFSEVQGLSRVLRYAILRTAEMEAANNNRGEKMQVLYDYLISEEFKQQMEAIVRGFVNMKNQLESEKRAMKRIWKQREKELELIIDGATEMHGSIRAIAGNAISPIKELELLDSEFLEHTEIKEAI